VGRCTTSSQKHRCADATATPHQELRHRARRAVLVGEAKAPLQQQKPDDTDDPTGSPSILKEPAMQIGKEQQEFEILPTEEDQQPVAPPPPEPQQQPEDAPA
jgi:hypothetical protein